MAQGRIRVPHTLVLLFGMVVAAWLLTFVLPQGSFERVESHGHERVVPDSYTPDAERTWLGPQTVFTAIPIGFEKAQGIIFFVFIIGGAFGVFRATGSADAMIGFALQRLGNYPALLIAGAMTVFAAGSATFGMAEEYLPFVPILLALCISFGFDAMTAIGVMCVGYGVGYGAAVTNPFTVFIAQDVAGVQQGSGWPFRLVLLAVFGAIGFHHVWSYARRVKRDPSKSFVADIPPDEAHTNRERVALGAHHTVVLLTLAFFIVVLIWGLPTRGWYLTEMSALFVLVAVVLGLLGRLGMDGTAKHFCIGAAELTTTALLIGFARGIEVVLDEGRIIDTIVHGIAQPLGALGSSFAAVGMLAVQCLCNFFIPSGSGQAYVTMPIMAPLADLVGVTRQTAVLAYQFGDGFTNILVPTNAVLIGILTMAKIPYERWLRFVVPFMLKILVAAAVALVVAVAIGYR